MSIAKATCPLSLSPGGIAARQDHRVQVDHHDHDHDLVHDHDHDFDLDLHHEIIDLDIDLHHDHNHDLDHDDDLHLDHNGDHILMKTSAAARPTQCDGLPKSRSDQA